MKKRFLPQDMAEICYLSSPAITSNGETVAYVSTIGNAENGLFFSKIMVIRNGGEPCSLPAPAGSSQTQPAFLGRHLIAYLSDEGGRKQIYLCDLCSGDKKSSPRPDMVSRDFVRVKGRKPLLLSWICGRKI